MADFLCNRYIDCPGTDSPVVNLSSEAIDEEYWRAIGYCCDGAIKQYFSNVSYDDALDGLQRTIMEECDPCPRASHTTTDKDDPIFKGPPDEVNLDPDPICNEAQVCEVTLNGNTFQYTIPACLVFGRTLAEANALALQLACLRAKDSVTPSGGGYRGGTNENAGGSGGSGGAGGSADTTGGGPVFFQPENPDSGYILLSGLPSGGCVNNLYSGTIQVGTNITPLTFTIVAGSIPPGLTFYGGTTSSRLIPLTGIPNTAGIYAFTVRATDGSGHTTTRNYAIRVLEISPENLIAAEKNVAYAAGFTVVGGSGTTTWSLFSGSLPDGLTLSTAGIISGTPTESGDFLFTVQATNSGQSCTKGYLLQVAGDMVCPQPAPFSFVPPNNYDAWYGTAADLNLTMDSAAFLDSQGLFANNADFNSLTYEVELIDFNAGPPAVFTRFAGEVANSHTIALHYDQQQDVLLSATGIGTYPAYTSYAISFFHPITGFLASISIADKFRPTPNLTGNVFCRMPGNDYRVAAMQYSSVAPGQGATVHVINVQTQAIDRSLNIALEATENFPSGFAYTYSCKDNRFYFPVYVSGVMNLIGYNAQTGDREVMFPFAVDLSSLVYVDSLGQLAACDTTNHTIVIIETTLGTITQTLTEMNGDQFSACSYSFKLDRLLGLPYDMGPGIFISIYNPSDWTYSLADTDNPVWIAAPYPWVIHDGATGDFYTRIEYIGRIWRYPIT